MDIARATARKAIREAEAPQETQQSRPGSAPRRQPEDPALAFARIARTVCGIIALETSIAEGRQPQPIRHRHPYPSPVLRPEPAKPAPGIRPEIHAGTATARADSPSDEPEAEVFASLLEGICQEIGITAGVGGTNGEVEAAVLIARPAGPMASQVVEPSPSRLFATGPPACVSG